MKYSNPILNADYSDPDVIYHNGGYYLVSSSFNYVPGIPVMYSTDLVNYKIISYVIKKLPSYYNKVRPSNGAWAPSIQFYKDRFYVFIPFPDKGIYYSTCKNPFKRDWSKLKPLYLLKGIEDPTVLFENNKAYLIFAFVKSRIGFNSKLALMEFSLDLKKKLLPNYKIIYEADENSQTIEGPKIYKINDIYYIFAPALGVEHGSQVVLSSKSIYGPYKLKTVLKECGNKINGPHQGSLIHFNDNQYAFLHFSHDETLGRIVYLQPAKLLDNGEFEIGDNGKPIYNGEIPTIENKTNYIDYSDKFNSNKLSLIWQTPANVTDDFILPTTSGLFLTTKQLKKQNLADFPYVLTQKFSSKKFVCSVEFELSNLKIGANFGLAIIGEQFSYIEILKRQNSFLISYYTHNLNSKIDKLIKQKEFNKLPSNQIILEFGNNLANIYLDKSNFNYSFNCIKQHYIGLRIGLFTYSKDEIEDSKIKFTNFNIKYL